MFLFVYLNIELIRPSHFGLRFLTSESDMQDQDPNYDEDLYDENGELIAREKFDAKKNKHTSIFSSFYEFSCIFPLSRILFPEMIQAQITYVSS